MAPAGWQFWQLRRVDDGRVQWLAVTKPGARSAIDQHKVWTLVPRLAVFVANRYVTQDHHGEVGNEWVHENIDIEQARTVVIDLPEPEPAEIKRFTHPEAELTLQQIDRYPAAKILGKRVATTLTSRC
ncbi:hypothetical protein CSW57_21190 [Williamsia muralis]|uniref:Uncharacterized protein n=1 Tax=Williamsia marianensis TaxID=85044 RepID=A0A2G3PKU9_WILMA|nr:hypothetical protein CSW57_21190 [Williamsia marianensis]